MTPSSGSGASQTFALQYSDTAGAASLQQVWVYFNATLANPASNACMLYYSAVTNQINLLGDNGSSWQAATLGAATTLQNSQCSVNVAADGRPERQHLDLDCGDDVPTGLRRDEEYLPARCRYIWNNTGWQRLGHWSVGPTRVHRVGFGNAEFRIGRAQTFALQYSDTAGGEFATGVGVFQPPLANPASHACMLYYNIAINQIDLLNDGGHVASRHPGGRADVAEQPVLSECGGHHHRPERQ